MRRGEARRDRARRGGLLGAAEPGLPAWRCVALALAWPGLAWRGWLVVVPLPRVLVVVPLPRVRRLTLVCFISNG